jgi:3-methyl-2-oxobutanoate hydroxymethyltransferase
MSMQPKPVRVPDLKEAKRRGEKIAVLTAYDATMARLLDLAGVDVRRDRGDESFSDHAA